MIFAHSRSACCTTLSRCRWRRATRRSNSWSSAPIGCRRSRSGHLLIHLIQEGQWRQVLMFTRTKHGANRLTQQLEEPAFKVAAAIHVQQKPSGSRQGAGHVQAAGKSPVRLVATEVAARGLDIKELPQVVNYELPNVPEDYVHRIGRTGRAGANGEAISLVSSDESGAVARYRTGITPQHPDAADARVQDQS